MLTTYLLVSFYGSEATFIEVKSSFLTGPFPTDQLAADLHRHGHPKVLWIDMVSRDARGVFLTRIYTDGGQAKA